MTRMKKKLLGVLGGIPLGEWGVLKSKIEGRGKAFPLIATLLLTLTLHAEVICIWDGNGYTCSGSGTQVNVIGGGELAPVVTNSVGVCTNCSAIPPDRLCQLADAIEGEATEIEQLVSALATDLGETREAIEAQLFEIGTYRSFATNLQSQQQATNYLHTVDNGQTRAVNAAMPQVTNGVNLVASYRGATVHALNSVYNYASYTVEPKLEEYIGNLQYMEDIELPRISTAVQYIEYDLVPELREGCTACNSGSGGGGTGGGSSTNQTATGDWCTYEQGEAIKSLLRDLSNHVSRCHSVLVGISNNVAIVNQSIKDAIYAPYNAIPEYAGLGGQTWQDVYLQGADTPWGYESTNYLARIELLLYGISGVGTNSEAFAELTDQMEDTDSAIDNIRAQLGSLHSDASGQQAQTLGQAIVNLFDAFTPTASELSSGTELMPATTYSINGQEFEVPQIIAQGGAISTFNSIQSVTRGVASALYGIVGAFAIFLYWRWFADKAVFFSKWSVELVSTLFYQ